MTRPDGKFREGIFRGAANRQFLRKATFATVAGSRGHYGRSQQSNNPHGKASRDRALERASFGEHVMSSIYVIPAPKGALVRIEEGGATIATARVVGCYIDDLWVAPAQRGCGLGRQLVDRCVQQGADLAIAVSDEAKRLFRRLGWKTANQLRWSLK